MAFTLHSHSGEFCPGHAKDRLAVVVKRAYEMGFRVMGLSEHMPRLAMEDLYPEELEPSPEEELAEHFPRHARYLAAATALRDEYAPLGLRILIGFECDWIRAADYGPLVNRLKTDVDYFIGSVHHVLGVPVDYDAATYSRACDAAIEGGYLPAHIALDDSKAAPEEEEAGLGGTTSTTIAERIAERRERALYNGYYADQHDMLIETTPPVVGHFDVIRLLSRRPDRPLRAWPEVWDRVMANLKLARDAGALLECNTSALRKGLGEPYPTREISEAWIGLGGKFCLGDDSHGTAQLGTNYARGLDFLESLGVGEVFTLAKDGGVVGHEAVAVRDVRACVEAEAWVRLQGL